MKYPTLSIFLTLTTLALLSMQTPFFADTKRLGVHLEISTEFFDECDVSTRYKKYELFLSSTPAVPSTLLIRQFECSNDVEPGVAESGSSGTNDLADFLLSALT